MKNNLSHIRPYKLNEIYYAIYDAQQKFGITDEYLLSTVRFSQQDVDHREDLIKLLDLLKKARDDLITWYLKQTLVELNVTISLVTAQIKIIQYKLGQCDGLDLHQACSLSLVDFCNILSELTVINVSPSERKTMHMVSEERNIPFWLSHYRNQICHVPSESPSISILVPLVQKSLNYMKESFWIKVIKHETFDEDKFKKIVAYVAKLTHVHYINKHLHIRKDTELGRKRMKFAEMSLEKYKKVCVAFRRSLLHSPEQAVDILTRFMVSAKYDEQSRNHSLLIVQLIYSKCFERFVFKLISLAEAKPCDKKIISWLNKIICLISSPKQEQLVDNLTEMGINAKEVIKYVDIAPIKCCRIAYRLMQLEGPAFKRCLLRMRHKLRPILGKEKALLLIRMTQITGLDRKI